MAGSLVELQSTALSRPPYYDQGHFGVIGGVNEERNCGVFGIVFHQVMVIDRRRRVQKRRVRRSHFSGARCGM